MMMIISRAKSVNTITRKPEAPNFTPTEDGLDVNAENTKQLSHVPSAYTIRQNHKQADSQQIV
jgi:hypothetical protein